MLTKQASVASKVSIFLILFLITAGLVLSQVQNTHNVTGVKKEVQSSTAGSYGRVLKWNPTTGLWTAQLDSLSSGSADSLAVYLIRANGDTLYICDQVSKALITIGAAADDSTTDKISFAQDPVVAGLRAWIDSSNVRVAGIAIDDINNNAIGFVNKEAVRDSITAWITRSLDFLDSTKVAADKFAVSDVNQLTVRLAEKMATSAIDDSLRRFGITASAQDSSGVFSHGTTWDLTDGQYTGETVYGKANIALIFGNVCFMDSDGEYSTADADSSITMPARVMALGTIAANEYGLFLIRGYVCEADWTTVQTKGANVFVDVTTGRATTTQPSGSKDQSQKIGYCIGTDIMFFSPDQTIVEVP